MPIDSWPNEDAPAGYRGGWETSIIGQVLSEIRQQLDSLVDVGVGYLTPPSPGRLLLSAARGNTHPSGDADRLQPQRRALRVGQAHHRAALPRHGRLGCAPWTPFGTSATPWWWWSTTAKTMKAADAHRDGAPAAGGWARCCRTGPTGSGGLKRAHGAPTFGAGFGHRAAGASGASGAGSRYGSAAHHNLKNIDVKDSPGRVHLSAACRAPARAASSTTCSTRPPAQVGPRLS